MDAFVGSIFSFGFNFAPYGWHLCDGTLLAISQNQALFSLLGTTFGGDGIQTFALPNLQSRVPIGTGQGAGLSNYVLGQAAGNEAVTLLVNNLPAHNHPLLTANVPVNSGRGTATNDPNGNYFGTSDATVGNAYNTTAGVTPVQMAPNNAQSGITGSGIPVSILNPFLTINYSIALQGIYPQRN